MPEGWKMTNHSVDATGSDSMEGRVYFGDNLPILQGMLASSVDLIYIDPPFNTGKRQARTQIETIASHDGDRT